jgi:hypothetical protein
MSQTDANAPEELLAEGEAVVMFPAEAVVRLAVVGTRVDVDVGLVDADVEIDAVDDVDEVAADEVFEVLTDLVVPKVVSTGGGPAKRTEKKKKKKRKKKKKEVSNANKRI